MNSMGVQIQLCLNKHKEDIKNEIRNNQQNLMVFEENYNKIDNFVFDKKIGRKFTNELRPYLFKYVINQ